MVLAQPQGTFTPTGDMTAQRMGHTATLLTNGKVLVTEGCAVPAGFPVWASAELYDPLTGKFALTGSMITPRAGHTSTLLGWKGPDLRRLPFQCARLASEFRRERGTV